MAQLRSAVLVLVAEGVYTVRIKLLACTEVTIKGVSLSVVPSVSFVRSDGTLSALWSNITLSVGTES